MKNKFLTLFLIVTIYFPGITIADEGCCNDDCTCQWEKQGTALTVKAIGNNVVMKDYDSNSAPAAWGTDITNVTIEGNFETIGQHAFRHALSLEYIDINGSIKNINNGAFRHTGVTHIELPDGVENIAREGFSENSQLEHITIPNTVVSIGAWAFQFSGLTEIEIPNGVKNIGAGAFDQCTNLQKLVIPDSVETFAYEDEQYGYLTFRSVNLTELTIGADNLTKYLNADGGFKETGVLNITCISGNCQTALEAWDEAHDTNYASRAKTIITNTDGSKTIYDLNGHFIGYQEKRIYTVEEAKQAVEAAGTDTVNFRIRYK